MALLYYLASKYLENKGNNAYEAFCQVDFCFGNLPNTNHVYSNVKKNYTHERFDDECFNENISFLEKYSENTRTFFESHSIFGEPFQIRIFLHVDYIQVVQAIEEQDESEVEEESEVEDESEEEEPPKVPKSFKTDQCVVCLSKEPKILFFNCLHYCVCSECEEANPFRKCPSCRTRVETKVMI